MKNKLFILLLSLFSVFIISDRVDALSYSVNGVSYNVNNFETLRDYAYFTYVEPNNYNYLSVWCYNRNNCFIYLGNISNVFYDGSNISWSGCNPIKTFIYNGSTFNKDGSDGYGGWGSSLSSIYQFKYSNLDTYTNNTYTTIRNNANFTFGDIDYAYGNIDIYEIKYYLNNVLIDTISVESGSSHTLKNNPTYDSSTQYWSGWTYGSNINLNNITSDVNIYGTISDKPIYQIKYYLNNELYHTDNVIEGNSYTISDYTDYNSYTHTFSGWTYDNNIDLTDVRQNVDITGTLIEKEKTPVYIDFPINKNEFYSLMVLIGVLILTQIFRVVYSSKGGKDL